MSRFISIHEADGFTFFRIPKMLFTEPKYKNISTDAKLLYGVLLDRVGLSKKNNWADELGRVYIIFSRVETQKLLGFKKDKVTKLFKELREVDLIMEKRQGLNKPNLVYVKKFTEEKHNDSGMRKNSIPECEKTAPNDTNNNNTNKKETKPVSQSVKKEVIIEKKLNTNNKRIIKKEHSVRDIPALKNILKEKLKLEEIKDNHEYEKSLVDEIELNILDMYFSNSTIINGVEKQQDIIQTAVMALTPKHIEELLFKFGKIKTKIKNPKAYMQSMIYNIIFENSISLVNQVLTDM